MTDNNLDPFVYHLKKCGKERSQIHSSWLCVEEDENVDLLVEDEDEDLVETQYCNRNNEVVKRFNEKCVICYERDSVYAFRQCGHQWNCEQCYQNKGGIDLLNCVVCRTK